VASPNSEYIERYQIELERNPRSKVFAPLAEAYRRMDLMDEALRIAQAGVEFHPEFVSGRVALAKVLIAQEKYSEALTHLEKACLLASDNILAHSLLGETLLKLRKPREALKSFKMVLFHSPTDLRALQVVQKWEFMTADEYEAEVFPDEPANLPAPPASPHLDQEAWQDRELKRALSLADAFTVRNDPERAIETLEEARTRLGDVSELKSRLKILQSRPLPSTKSPGQYRREKLLTFLQRINERRLS
jgi:tetratricopeptide (TPR) repeat protein